MFRKVSGFLEDLEVYRAGVFCWALRSGSVVVFQGFGFAIRQAEVLTGGGGETGFSFNEVTCLRASTSKVVCCHFSSDGKLLASAGHDKRVSMRSPWLYMLQVEDGSVDFEWYW